MPMPKYPDGEFKQSQYISDFKKEKYDRIAYEVPKGGKDILRGLATQRKISVNALITHALESQYNITLKPKD